MSLADQMRKGYEMTVPSRRGCTTGQGRDGKLACCPLAAAAVALGWNGLRQHRRLAIIHQVLDYLLWQGYPLCHDDAKDIIRRYDGKGCRPHTREEVLAYVEGLGL